MARTKRSMERAVRRYLRATIYGGVRNTTHARLDADVREIRQVLGNDAVWDIWKSFEEEIHYSTTESLYEAWGDSFPGEKIGAA